MVYERLPRDSDGGETTLKVKTGGKEVWVRVEPDIFGAPTQSYKLSIVEVAAMQQVVTDTIWGGFLTGFSAWAGVMATRWLT